jgi:hypothetical protein
MSIARLLSVSQYSSPAVEAVVVVEIVECIGDEVFEAVLFDPFSDRFREEMLLILIVVDKVIGHRWILDLESCSS